MKKNGERHSQMPNMSNKKEVKKAVIEINNSSAVRDSTKSEMQVEFNAYNQQKIKEEKNALSPKEAKTVERLSRPLSR